MQELERMGAEARAAALELAVTGSQARDAALLAMADALERSQEAILAANEADVASARAAGQKEAFVERLTLTPKRVKDMAASLREVAALPDPLGRADGMWTRPNGLRILKCRTPLGVVGIIYESRPNVTADAAGLCVKSGNACILRGGSEALRSNAAILDAMAEAAGQAGLPKGCLNLVRDPSRETAAALMRMQGTLDVLIPRGGAGLIRQVLSTATVPVIETGTGNCHVYVDGRCEDFAMARDIIYNAKVSRPSVCNAAETLLVDAAIAPQFLPACVRQLQGAGVEIRGCAVTRSLCPGVEAAAEADWETEYNDLILAVKVVDGVMEAIGHINRYGTGHSEAIVTQDVGRAQTFMDRVDAAAVYLNASTRFTDGGEFGFGAEIGISNQKLHARGPMGLEQLTTIKYKVFGSGQVR